MVNFPIPADLPPASMPWVREVQARMEALEADNLRLKNQMANVTSASPTPQGTLSQPDLVNSGVLIGDAPTLYVEPYAYFTRSGMTLGGLNVSWDYRGSNGELLAGPSEEFEVWVREVRVESDYPAFADMRVDPPPTGDSQRALSTQSMYGVIQRLDIQTTYAVKVRSMTSLGVPGNFSDETIVTTPKEPRLRPIDPPILDEYPDGVSVGWDWTQRFDPGTPGYSDALGFDALAVNIPLTGDEKMYHIATADNGRVYVRIQGTGSLWYAVAKPDGTWATFDGTKFIAKGGSHIGIKFATGHDGNLYSLTNNAGTGSGDGANGAYNFANISGISPGDEIVWVIDTSLDTVTAIPRTPEVWPDSWSTPGVTTPILLSSPISHPDGIIMLVAHDYPYKYGYRILNTSSLLSTLNVTAGASIDSGIASQWYSSRIHWISDTVFIYPISGISSYPGGTPDRLRIPYNDSIQSVGKVAYFDTVAGTYSVRTIVNPSSIMLYHANVLGGRIYAKAELYPSEYHLQELVPDGTSDMLIQDMNVGALDLYQQTQIDNWIVGATQPSRWTTGFAKNGLWLYDTTSGYSYTYESSWSAKGVYGPPVNTHAIPTMTGDMSKILDDAPDPVFRAYDYRPDLDMGRVADNRVWTVGRYGITFLSPVLISGDPGTPSFPLNPATPWPEIKYVIAQRLTGASTWIDVGTYLGPGTINDPLPAGTYSYRLVPVSTTGQRGDPTALQTITIT